MKKVVDKPEDKYTVKDISTILTFLKDRLRNPGIKDGLSLICTYVFSLTQKGTISLNKVSRLQQNVNEQLSTQLAVSADAMKLVYSKYGGYIDGSNAHILFQHWNDIIPDIGLRLRLAVQQASYHGLTSLRIVGQAINSYQDFPWYKVSAILAAEWNAYHTAVETIGNNPYFGFNKDLGVVAANHYRTLTWVGWNVLIKGCPSSPYEAYKGITKTPQEQSRLERIINAYFRARAAYLSADEPEDESMVAKDKEKVEALVRAMQKCGNLFVL